MLSSFMHACRTARAQYNRLTLSDSHGPPPAELGDVDRCRGRPGIHRVGVGHGEVRDQGGGARSLALLQTTEVTVKGVWWVGVV